MTKVRRTSLLDFACKFVQVHFLFFVPVPIFVFSGFLVPDWKGACVAGWVDLFMASKLALLPLVIWSLLAAYLYDYARNPVLPRAWVIFGYVAGAVVSTASAIVGLMVVKPQNVGWFYVFMIVPYYVAGFFLFRAFVLVRTFPLRLKDWLWGILATAPFFWLSMWWAMHMYAELPDNPPSCFVVTAASRGHAQVVGPLVAHERRGAVRLVNAQLLTFWRLEARWNAVSPNTHRAFRRVYNRLGPLVARRLRHPLAADAMYLALKPLEWAARLVVR